MSEDDTTAEDAIDLEKLRAQLFGPSNEAPNPASGRRRTPDEDFRRFVVEMFRPSS